MKYYSYRNIVVAMENDTHYKAIVSKVRIVTNMSYIMIEDIRQVDVDDYIKYLEDSKIDLQRLLDNKSSVIARLRMDLTEDVSLPF